MRPRLGLAELVSAAGVDPTAVLFVLAHGVAERPASVPGGVRCGSYCSSRRGFSRSARPPVIVWASSTAPHGPMTHTGQK